MSACKACGAEITWRRIGGKNHKLNADGSNHWAGCKPKAKFRTLNGGTTVGENYAPFNCGCDVLPWEACPCSDPGAEGAARFLSDAQSRLEFLLADA